MAFIWLNPEGEGVAVQETAAEARRRIEDEDSRFVGFLLDPCDGTEPYKTVYVERASVYAIESGRGVLEDEEEA